MYESSYFFFQITPEEQKLITSAFANSEAPKADAKQPEEEHSKARDAILSHGVHLAGVKYFTVSITGRTIQVRKGLNGAVIVKTEQAVLVALYEEPIQAPEASGVVEPLADYLISQKY